MIRSVRLNKKRELYMSNIMPQKEYFVKNILTYVKTFKLKKIYFFQQLWYHSHIGYR